MTMTSIALDTPSPAAVWTGRVLSALVVLFLAFDGTIKLIPLDVYPRAPLRRALFPLRWASAP